MDPVARFVAYAAAFEVAYATDDWSKIEPFFTEDAVYRPPPGFGEPIVGRAALMVAFKAIVDASDRRFASRAVEVLDGPALRDGVVWMRWAATYTLPGAPALRMVGEETAAFSGDRIQRLEDEMSDAEIGQVQAYMARHAALLAASG